MGYPKQKVIHTACFPGALLLKDLGKYSVHCQKPQIKYLICKNISDEGSHKTFSDFEPVALDWTSRLPGSGVIRATAWKRWRSSGPLSRKQQCRPRLRQGLTTHRPADHGTAAEEAPAVIHMVQEESAEQQELIGALSGLKMSKKIFPNTKYGLSPLPG